MSGLHSFFRGWEYFILVYFSVLALIYAVSGYLGMRSIIGYARGFSQVGLKDLLERDFYKPVSILVRAYNEEVGIVANVSTLLNLRHPQFEVIIASDGSTDRTLALLTEAFELVEVPSANRRSVPTKPVRRVLRSLAHPNLMVVDKENGGMADATNAALNLARFPLVCAVDADCILDGEALVRATRLFVEDETVVGVGGTLRPLNGAVLSDNRVTEVRAPTKWVERVQVLEYARAFFTARTAWSRVNSLMIISGAFGLFRRDAVLRVGGWWTGTVADDMEMVVKLHRYFRQNRQPYRIVFSPDPICWTEVPSTFRALCRQRHGWQRGLCEVLWRHRAMLLNPRYGRVGLIGIPYLWFFEALAALVEPFGYLYIITSAVLGDLNVRFAILFFVLAILYAVLLSELAMGIETLLLVRYSTWRDRAVLFVAAFVEFAGFHQVLTFVRMAATFQFRHHRGRYWTTERSALARVLDPAVVPSAVVPSAETAS